VGGREEALEVRPGGVVEQDLGERHGGGERRVEWRSGAGEKEGEGKGKKF
jgi:hypothetical protein